MLLLNAVFLAVPFATADGFGDDAFRTAQGTGREKVIQLYSLLKQEFDSELNWFVLFKVWLDLDYLGIKTNYQALEINIPHKKPRKSKANPNPHLTPEQKAENQQISRRRIMVEHAICWMKRFRIVTTVFRNRKENFVDDVAAIAALYPIGSLSAELPLNKQQV
jgi:hypothetical protein